MESMSDLLRAGHIALDVRAADFDAALAALVHALGERSELGAPQREALTAALRDRERLAATCVGRGVAVPHAYVEGVPRVLLLFARLATGLAHDAPDGRPVDLVFLLAGPSRAQTAHLPLLARFMRLLHDERLLSDLRAADGAESVLRAVRAVEQRHA